MGGDYTRFTFDPRKNYSAVLKQQGRVGLDSDANEDAEIQDRRWRAETLDIMGSCVVSDYTNRDAFEITGFSCVDDGNPCDFSIGVGRMYVDGLQVENHGTGGNQLFDPTLEEMRSAEAVSYYDQRFYPSPPNIERPQQNSRTDLVYLDVWQREVTALEDPEIREVALGGPDTATRLQTIWQVKVSINVSAQSCRDNSLEQVWNNLTAPSAGRLTVGTVTPPPSDLPCELSPEGGYRGLENRLYRVEIHDLGSPRSEAPPSFKWSRDNASVTAAVKSIEEVSGDGVRRKLFLSSLGRNRYLRFRAGDWIEVLDDRRELHGRPGQMVRIVETPDQTEQSVIVVGSNLGW